MALIRYGGGIVQMSGSIAGNTFARNRYGNYNRARTTPVNPMSSRQTAIRAAMSYLTEEWSDVLTAAQRTAWNSYASNVTMQNRLGEDIHLSGFNHFVRSGLATEQCGSSYVAAGPTAMTLPAADSTFTVALSAASGVTVTFDDTFDWADEDGGHLSLHLGNPQGAGITFFNGPWRWHAAIDGDSVTPPTSPDGPTAVTCWTLIQNQLVWAKARIIRDDGRISQPFYAGPITVGA